MRVCLLVLLVLQLRAAEVFMIGHSLVNFDMPWCFDALAAGQDGHRTGLQVTNGAPLKWNWSHADQAQGGNGRELLPAGHWDHLVLTTASPIQQHLRWSEPEVFGAQFAALALAGNADCQIWLYATWPNRDPGEWKQASWDAELDADLAGLKQLASQIDATCTPATPTRLIPASLAIRALRDGIAAGQVPGLTSLDQVFADTIHMNDLGNWFIANLFHACIYGGDLQALPTTVPGRYGGSFITVPADQAVAMRRIITALLSTTTGTD